MIIHKATRYKKCIGKLKKKHMSRELEIVQLIEDLLLNYENMQVLLISPLWKIYRFEKLIGDKKELYSARINKQLRLEFKPVNDPGYEMNDVIEIDLIEISDHYKKL